MYVLIHTICIACIYIYMDIICCIAYHDMDDVYDVVDYMKSMYMSI